MNSGGSALEPTEEPVRSDHLRPQFLDTAPELPIRGDQGDRFVRRSSHDVDERVITASPPHA